MPVQRSYIPGPNGKFDDYQNKLIPYISSHMSSWALPTGAAAEFTLLSATAGVKKMRWDAAYAIVKTKVFTHPQEVEMLAARKDYEFGHKDIATDTSIRLFVTRYIRNNPKVTVEQKAEMGLLVSEVEPTESTNVFATRSANAVTGRVKKNLHLSHVNMVDFDDQESHAKPAGVKDIQIFIIITDADVAETPALDTFSYAGTTSGGRYKHTFTDAQEGKRAWYYARFVFTGKVPTYGTPSKVWDGIIS